MLLRAELASEYSGYPLVATNGDKDDALDKWWGGILLWSNGKYGEPLIPLKLVGTAPGWGINDAGVVVFGSLYAGCCE